jgi:hypothetical protein
VCLVEDAAGSAAFGARVSDLAGGAPGASIAWRAGAER